MNHDLPFSPNYGTAQLITTSDTVTAVSLLGNSNAICLTNTSSVRVTVRLGVTDAINNAGYIVLPGSQVIIGKPTDERRLTVISSSAGSLHVIEGRGI